MIWYYGVAVKNLFQIWLNFVWFIYHFFSLGVLTRTFFAPWRRLNEGYAKGLAPESWGETLIVNTLMRLVGMLIRLIFIVIGAATLIVTVVLIIPVLIVWLILPFIVVGLVVGGLILLFQ